MTSEGAEPTKTRFDLIDRFERVIDMQVMVLGEIDQKAGYVTRLVALILGVTVSVLSIGIRQGGALNVALPTVLTFGLGIAGLITSMSGAIVTYLSSKLKLGVHPATAAAFEESPISRSTYSRLVMNSYANTLKKNRQVLNVNARRLRYTLASLVLGICHLALAAIQHVATRSEQGKLIVAGLGSLAIFGACGFVLSGRYLVLEER